MEEQCALTRTNSYSRPVPSTFAVKTPLAFNNFKLSLRSTLSPFLSTSTTPPRPSNPPSPSSPPSPTTASAEAAHVAAVAVAVAEALTVRIPAAEAMEETSSPSCHGKQKIHNSQYIPYFLWLCYVFIMCPSFF